MPTNRRDNELEPLLAVILGGEKEAAEALARYAEDPSSVGPDERAALESSLAGSPERADQLKVLREFDLDAVLAESDESQGGGRGSTGSVGRLVALHGRARKTPPPPSRWSSSPAFAGVVLAAAAGLASILYFVDPSRLIDAPETSTASSERIADLEGELARERDRAAELAAALEQRAPSGGAADDSARLAELEATLLERDQSIALLSEETNAARDALERATKIGDQRALEIERLEDELAGKSSPEMIASHRDVDPKASPLSENAVRPGSAPVGGIPGGGANPLELADPIQIASNADFALPNAGDPSTRTVFRSAHSASVPRLTAWVPAQAGWTTEAQPVLYVHFSSTTSLPVRVTIARGPEIIADKRLPSPVRAGVLRVKLADLGVELEAGAVYDWLIAVQPDPLRRDRDVIAGGALKRVAPPASVVSARAKVDPRSILEALERAGLWYDALDLVSQWIDHHPSSANLRAHRRSLLDSVGIEANE